MPRLKINFVAGGASAGAKHRQLAGQLRQVATLIGPGMVISILPNGVWMLDDEPAPRYDFNTKRYSTTYWARRSRRESS